MQGLLSCLENVVGLSDTSCDCWDVSKPTDFASLNESKSGFYVSQPDTFSVKITNTAADCEQGGVWDMLVHARKTGIRNFLAAFSTRVSENLQQTRQDYNDYIAKAFFNNAISTYKDVQGHYYEPYKIKGGVMVIKSVDLALRGVTTGTNVDVFVYSSLDLNTPLGSTTVTLSASDTYATATFTTPIQIDLGEIREDLNERIFIAYELPVGTSPLNNEMLEDCGCGTNKRLAQNPFLQWLCEAKGFESATFADIPRQISASAYGKGLRVDVSIFCDWMGWLCDVTTNQNEMVVQGGEYYSISRSLALAIQFSSVVALMDTMINSPNLKKYSILGEDKHYYAKRGHYAKQLKETVIFLVQNMPEYANNCLACKNKDDLGRYRIQ